MKRPFHSAFTTIAAIKHFLWRSSVGRDFITREVPSVPLMLSAVVCQTYHTAFCRHSHPIAKLISKIRVMDEYLVINYGSYSEIEINGVYKSVVQQHH